ncbi:OLC1v1021495C2 [Oldenlandia corymbosa var. corymbosa]|uniref:OLC1v1021495C2 n=1 Tax=Oldenlandia corymbosa var. corymbosa TaxID=529605 RepID=A0AAV1BWD9_OLDCO|nr:OLC1v1021495C2 [Oldenlandia corymbosa var. corymbosa]
METKSSGREDLSTAQAVLIGALAPGVNSPTWNTLKIAFLMLGLSLVAMMGLAFSSSDLTMTLHVVVLVLITGTLFFLLNSIQNVPNIGRGRCIAELFSFLQISSLLRKII